MTASFGKKLIWFYHLCRVILLRYNMDFQLVIYVGKAGRRTMDQQTQWTVSPIGWLRTWGASVRLDVLLCLCALAIQILIPAAQVWHIATEHTTAIPSQLKRHSGEFLSLAFSVKPDIPQGHEAYNLLACPVCQAFVHLSDAAETRLDLSVELTTPNPHFFLRGPPLCQAPLQASASRAPPILS